MSSCQAQCKGPPCGQCTSAHVQASRGAHAPLRPAACAVQVPGLPADRLATLDAADRMRLEAEREAALKAEAEQRKVGWSCATSLLLRVAAAAALVEACAGRSARPLLGRTRALSRISRRHLGTSSISMLTSFATPAGGGGARRGCRQARVLHPRPGRHAPDPVQGHARRGGGAAAVGAGCGAE